ncbi:MAG: sensor histidine kinase [Winogradskyella arenosi]
MLKQIIFIGFLCFGSILYLGAQNKALNQINALIEQSQDLNFDVNQRLEFALRSSELATETQIDSLILKANRNLSVSYFHSELYDKYISLNRGNFELAKKLNDSSSIIVAASNLGSSYRYFEENDSSYYFYSQSLKYFSPNEISEKKATALLYIADILQIEKIYAGAEESAIKSIQILSRLPKNKVRSDKLWNAYNLLGIISKELGHYQAAIDYYDKSNAYTDIIDDGYLNEIYSINNKAGVYRRMGDYAKAIELYESLLEARNQYEGEDPSFYATILNNVADTELESGNYNFETVQGQFSDAYRMANDLDDDVLKMNVALHTAKLYKEEQVLDSVVKYAHEALTISYEVSSNEIKQEALLLLADTDDGDKGKYYLKEHIRISDSLLEVDHAVRNKYARIEFETDELEAQNERIEAENAQISKENLYLVMLTLGVIFFAILLYIVILQRVRNRKLEMLQLQQKANEDIYNLMLVQQDKVDEARAKEKVRVSKELHDGVLGRLFGIRLSLDSINLKEGQDAVLTRAKYIQQLQNVEQDIRKISHELNTDFVSGSGFMDIVQELVENQAVAYDLAYSFKFTDDIDWDEISNKTKINIYRIIQESMQNIYKHANANHIEISISLEKGLICLNITDDGDGFDSSKTKKGIGLKNMKSRVEDINGTITFTSEKGNGTLVNVKFPYINL